MNMKMANKSQIFNGPKNRITFFLVQINIS